MATSVGDLAINVSTNTASVEVGFNKVADIVGRFARDTTRSVDTATGRLTALGDTLRHLAEITVAGIGVHQFAEMITGAIEATARLQDLGVVAGTTAAQMSALEPAAKLSGTSMESVATASARFSKNLIDVQTGTGKAAAAFQALGFSANDAARFLKDPAQGLLEVAQRLNEFQDDGNKSAAILTLLGRNAQEILPFLKQLGEQQQLVARTSNEQAKAAHDLEDQYRTLQLNTDALKRTIGSGLIDVLSSLLDRMNEATGAAGSLREEIVGLAQEGTLAKWALEIARALVIVEETFVALGHGAAALGASFVVLADDIRIVGATGQLLSPATFAAGMDALKQALADRKADLAVERVAWDDFWNGQYDAMSKSLTKQIEALDAAKGKLRAGLTDIRSVIGTPGNTPGGSAESSLFGENFQPPKKSIDFSGALATQTVDAFTRAMQTAEKAITDAQIALDDFGATAAEQTSPAMRQLIDLLGSDEFSKFSKAQQERITNAYLEADAVQHTTASLKQQQQAEDAYSNLLDEITGKANGFTADFAGKLAILDNAWREGAIKTAEEYESVLGKLVDFEFDQQAAKIQGDIAKINAAYQEFIDHIETSAKAQQLEIDLLGKAPDEIARARAEFQAQADVQAQINKLTADWAVLVGKGQYEQAGAVLAHLNDILNRQGQIVSSAGDLASAYEKASESASHIQDNIRELDSFTRDVFDSIFTKGDDTFKRIGDSIKKYLLDALYQLTVRPFVINLAANLTNFTPGAVASTLGQSGNPLSLLTGGGGGGFSNFLNTSGLGNLTSGGIFAPGGALAGFVQTPLANSLGIATGAVDTFGVGLEGGTAALTGFGSVLGAAIPVLGTVLAGLSLFGGSLFDHKPSPAKGQFGFSTGTTGFEDNAFVSTVIGQLHAGFLDANTQQFSGDAAKVFDQLVTGALDAFASRYSPAQSDRLAQVLQTTSFPTFEGTFSTQDFIAQYGGQVLQQVIAAAFDVLDPALGAVAAGFSGTADEVAKFGNTLLGIYDASKGFGDAFRANVVTALGDGSQATADKVLAFVQAINAFGDSLSGLGPKLEALDPASITAFVDALGGAQQFASTFQYLAANFTTGADKLDQAQRTLAADFANLGLGVPATHQAFLALLNSFDLTTESGRTLYSQVAALAPLFVQVAGTADQAAQALQQQVSSAADFFKQNFYTDAERQAKQIAADTQAIADAQKQLGIAIPTTIDGFRSLIEGIDQSTEAGKALYNQLIVLAPAVHDLGTAAQTAAQQITDAVNSISHPVDVQQYLDGVTNNIANIANLAQQSTGDFGDKLSLQVQLLGSAIQKTQDAIAQATAKNDYSRIAYLLTPQLKAYQSAQSQVANELARFITLSAQYDAARAEQLVGLEDWYAAQKKLFSGQADVMAALKTIYDEKWKAIVDGVSTGVDGAISQLDRLRKGIADYLKGLSIGELSPLTPTEQLHQAQLAYVDELTKAQTGDLGALGDITQFADAYLKEARDFFASSQNYTDIFSAVTQQLAELAGTTPTGLPLPGSTTTSENAALISALPTGSPMASQADVRENTLATRELQGTIFDLFGAQINATTQTSSEQTTILQRLLSAQQARTVTPR